MTKILYFIPLLLTGCLSTGDSSSTSSSHTVRQPPSSNRGPNASSPENKGSLDTFIDTDKFSQDITNTNDNNVKRALSSAKIQTSEKNVNIATEALKQNLADSSYISSKITQLDDVINNYNNNYLVKLEDYNKSQKNYAPVYYDGKYTPREEDETDDDFSYRLLQIIGNKYVNYGDVSSKSEYINQSLMKWANDIKKALGKSENDPILDIDRIQDQFYSLYTELTNIKTTIDNNYQNAKSELLGKIQVINPSVKEFPLSLGDLITYYQLEQSILKAIDSIDYINQSTPTKFNYTATSLYDDDDSKTVKFIYNEDSNSYTLLLSDIRIEDTNDNDTDDVRKNDETEPVKTIREVKFNASDFTSADNYYVASKVINVGDTVVYKTYFDNLKDYINAGGNYDFEISKRKNEATNIIKRIIYNQYPTKEDIDYFNNWFGTNLSEGFSQSDISSYLSEAQLAISILAKTNTVFDILKVNKISDTVKLGGKPLKLSYSDFGLWTIKESTEYAGDKDLIAAKKDIDVENTYNYIDNPFFTGLDEFKASFKTEPGSGINETVKFSGKTFAVAQKNDTRKDLTGNATMAINKQDATGSVNLAFDKWYNFTFNGIDFSSKGFSLNDTTVSVNNAVYDTDIKITSDKDSVKGNITGALYGPDIYNPTEGVGAFNITTGDNVKVNGAFGVKK